MYGILLVLGITAFGCVVSMMGLFLGSDSAGLELLITVQAWSIPFAVVVALAGVLGPVKNKGLRGGLTSLWNACPAWLLVAFFVLNSLTLVGELSFYLAEQVSGLAASWRDHVPLVCTLASSAAFCILFARAELQTPMQQV